MNDTMLLGLSAKEFRAQVELLLRTRRDLPLAELASLPLAHSSLVEECFLSGETANNRVRARVMQAVSLWAIDQLRPDGQVSWLDDASRLYNVLFYPYFEGMTFSQVAEKMGLSEQNLYQRVRPKAITALAKVFKRELKTKHNLPERKQYALAARCRNRSAEEDKLLRMLSIFRRPISHSLLYQLAEEEGISDVSVHIRHLLTANLLRSLDEGTRIECHAEVRAYQLTRLSPDERTGWHDSAGKYYQTGADYLEAADHFRRMRTAPGYQLAADVIIEHQQAISNQYPVAEVAAFVAQFRRHELPEIRWCQLKILAGDLAFANKNVAEAIEEYGQALHTTDIHTKALAYYRRALAYKRSDLDQALAHYTYCINFLEQSTLSDAQHQELPLLSKIYIDWAWIFIQERPNLAKAKQALQRAQDILSQDRETEAKLHNAWAGLYARQKESQQVISHRLQAWLAAEETQNVELKIKMAKNLGFDYAELRQAYDKALKYLNLSQTLALETGDQQMVGMSLKDIGACYFWMADYQKAIEYYQEAYDIYLESGNLNSLGFALYDMAEAYAEMGEIKQAKKCFDEGVGIAKKMGHAQLIDILNELAKKYAGLTPIGANLNSRQLKALDYVKQHGRITKQAYMKLSGKATATASRDLSDMCKKGFLVKKGKGRGTYYAQPT